MDTTFKGVVARLSDTDLPRIGYGIGVGEDEVHAFLDVETAGGGYDDEGRPKILFEPAKFYAHLSGDARAQAVAAGLAAPKWGDIPYGAQSSQYPKLIKAIAIDETAALKSASWGIGQVLGENFGAAGYDSVQTMVADMVNGGEAAQLQAAVNFIKANGLDDELRNHQWAAFARGYNGAGYAKNAYDTKLAARFKWWQGKPDTPWTPQARPSTTVYALTWGSSDIPKETRYFTFDHQSDAVARLAIAVLALDQAPANAAYASLSRLPDSVYPDGMPLVAWTKTSDERPTDEGSAEIPA
ncbi:MAG: N-acetylmuramidase family protein [Mesorhizobium sp.]|uniref:N-acetylmuramidase family protein n=1 Tax=Mesorhizobium sp. TaxID=1871066 RepID=UPI0011F97F76|nr:N-acetylmuramidase family protein [Mesorhizobium sp.]TJV51168.1 MAG: N-acetylmuramidase family protein [Mesorhizobium sp.]